MDVAHSVRDLIGRTPLLELHPPELASTVHLYAKLEMLNPGGSIKDRLGVHLVDRALADGRLTPGGTLVEPTAGNTGISLAIAAVGLDVHVVLVVPEHFSAEKQLLMRALGAEVINTRREDGMAGAIEKAQEIARERGGYCPQQFENPENPEAHRLGTGPELFRQLDGDVDVFVAGAGTGGTLTGVARYLKAERPGVEVVLVQPEGSVFSGGPAGRHRVEGIGNDFIPETLDLSLVDQIETISDDEAFAACCTLARSEGLLVGSSSGAAYVGALRVAQARARGRVVTIFPDGASRYLSCGIYRELDG